MKLGYRIALGAFVPISVAGLLVFGVLLASYVGDTDANPASDDFLAFYTGASMIRDGSGSELFNAKRQLNEQAKIVGHDPASWRLQAYFNPAPWAAAFVPLTGLALPDAYHIFLLAEMALLCVSLLLLWQILKGSQSSLKWLFLWGVLTMPPSLLSVIQAQTTLVTLAAVLLAALMMRSRPVVAGVVLSLVVIKPQIALPFLLMLTATQQWPALRGFTLGVVLLVVGSVILVGVHGITGEARFYLSAWNEAESYGLAATRQQNWTGFVYDYLPAYARILNPVGLSVIWAGALVAVWSLRAVRNPGVLLGAACLIALVSSPHLHIYDLALMAVAAAAVLAVAPVNNRITLLMLGWYYYFFFAVELGVLGRSFTVLPLIGTLLLFIRWARNRVEISGGAGWEYRDLVGEVVPAGGERVAVGVTI